MPDDKDVLRAIAYLDIEASGSQVRIGDLPVTPVLNAEERAFLTKVCSAVIPSSGVMPAAGDVLVPRYVEAVCARSKSLSLLLRNAVKELAVNDLVESVADTFEALERTDRAAFELLKGLIYEGYYSHASVLGGLQKTTGWRAETALVGSVMAAFDERLLAQVVELPASYRMESKRQ